MDRSWRLPGLFQIPGTTTALEQEVIKTTKATKREDIVMAVVER
jgi:hypothetical protein